MSVAQKDILNGWKEIAGYVARDIRTVERWEKQRGLPVRRVPGSGRATVYARISELEEWLASAKPEPESAIPVEESGVYANGSTHAGNGYHSTVIASVAPQNGIHAATPFSLGGIDPAPPAAPVQARPVFTRGIAVAAFCTICAIGVAGTLWLQHRPRAATAEAHSTANQPVPATDFYASKVPGVEDLYLRGTYFFEQRTPETLNEALASFNQAIQRDPQYAPAYAGLANTYNLLREYSLAPDDQAYPKAREAAEKAIALNPHLAEAHASLGYVEYYWYMDPVVAEREFCTALALDPNQAGAHHWYGSVLTHEGRYAEALRELDISQRLQPSSEAILISRALALGLSGHAQEARGMLSSLLSHDKASQDRNSTTAHLVLAMVSMTEPRDVPADLEQLREAAEIRKSKDLADDVNVALPAFRAGGEPAMWRALLVHEQSLHTRPGDRTLLMAESEANLGQPDQAFADLNQLASRHANSLVGLSMNPMLQPLHGDPRFEQLRARMGLPPLQ